MSVNGMELTVQNRTVFADAKTAPFCPAAHARR
jgi:hypothetical protein